MARTLAARAVVFSWLKRPRRRIPKHFLEPRPMASPAQRQHPFWDLVPFELLALVLCTVLIALGPLATADSVLYARLLSFAANTAPSTRVAVVEVAPERLRSRECGRDLRVLLENARARGGLLLGPLGALCAPEARSPALDVLPERAIRRDGRGHVLGFALHANRPTPLANVRPEDATWVAARPWASVPRVALGALESGQVPSDILVGRTVLFSLAPGQALAGDASGPLALETGAALGALLEDRPRRVAGRGAGIVIGAALLGLVAWKRRRPGLRAMNGWLFAGLGALLVLATLLGAFGIGYLLPLATLAITSGLFLAITELPAAVAARRARVGASRLLGETQQVGAQAGYLLPDEEFWARMARRVEQTHAAEGVLVAELPPFSWRLRIWPNGDLNESIIKERRRDVRRTPYVDEAGARRTHIVDGYLVMNGVPVVFAPLEAAGEVEGYLFLIGKAAAHAFVERPQATEQLAHELAQLIRHRRLERLRADAWRRPAGMLVENPAKWSESLLEKARAAIDDLGLLGEIFRSAPVGLLYADPFGDVRMVGERFVETLRLLGITPAGSGTSLPPGSLPLSKILADVAALAGRSGPLLSDITVQGLTLELETGEEGNERALELNVRRLESDGELSGFLATFVGSEARPRPSLTTDIPRLAERGDPLTVFSLAELASETVTLVAREAQLTLRFQTPREPGHAIGHRRELGEALAAFLSDVGRAQPGTEPVMTLRERGQWVELTLIDLRLGVPEAAMQRTVLASSIPPPGLEPLARFVRAVEESHGRVRLRGEQAWGAKLTISLLRARPRVQASALGRIIRISERPRGKRR